MVDLLRDPLWTFIGAILAVLAIVVSISLWMLQRRKKKLGYDVLSNLSLLTVREELEGRLKVLFDENPVKNVHLFVLRVVNNGNVPITPSDFERPLSLVFGENSNVLSAQVTETSPKNLKIELTTQRDRITFVPLLLNQKDSITVKLLVSDYKGPLVADARITGVRDVVPLREGQWRTPIVAFVGMITMVLGVLWGGGEDLFNASKFIASTKESVGLAVFFVGYILVGIAFVTNRRYMKLIRRLLRATKEKDAA